MKRIIAEKIAKEFSAACLLWGGHVLYLDIGSPVGFLFRLSLYGVSFPLLGGLYKPPLGLVEVGSILL
jgi:hypothetical protein